MSVILHGMLALAALGTTIEALGWREVEGALPLDEVLAGVLVCIVVVLLLVIDHFGYWRVATWGLLICLALSGCLFFDLATLDRFLIVSAVPVVVAAFVLRPAAAFQMAALSLGCYSLVWWRHGPTPGYNWLSILALAGVALVSWLTARRISWLEEAEDMSRRELDRLADERDVLKGQVRALADEVNRLRESAKSTGSPEDYVRRP